MDEQPGELSDLEQEPVGAVLETTDSFQPVTTPTKPSPQSNKPKRRLLIIVAAAVIIILIIIGIILLASHKQPAKKASTNITINTQSLSSGTLQTLEKNNSSSSNNVSERLVIAPNTLFKDGIEVEGPALFDNGVAITGDLNLSGNLNASGLVTAASLSVGSLTINNIQVNGNLNFSGHLNPTGSSPSAKTDVATSGGTVSVSGSDTAGTITITIGSGSTIAGELAVIDFHQAFPTTPHVQLTPANTSASQLHYFVTQSPSFFSVETSNAPTNGTTYLFNYFVTQ